MAEANHPFLDNALEAYRSAVKAWSRDTLLTGFVLLIAGVFIVVPYFRLEGLRADIEVERGQARAELADLIMAQDQLTAATNAIEEAQWQLQKTSEQVAAALSDDLRRVAQLAYQLRETAPPDVRGGAMSGTSGAAPAGTLPFVQQQAPLPEGPLPVQSPIDRPTFPSSLRVEQWQAPLDLPGAPLPPSTGWAAAPSLSPDAALREFGLDDSAIEQLRRALANGPGSAEWAATSSLGEAIFRRQIEAAYGALERAVASELGDLATVLEARLGRVEPLQGALGLTLPAASELVPKAVVVRLPPADRLFRSVAGKAEALGSIGLYEVQLDLKAARAPILASTDSLAETRRVVEDKRLTLEVRERETEAALDAIDTRLEAIASEAGSLGAPLQSLALDTGLFARLYPALLALAVLWLAVRRARLEALAMRLRQDFADTGIDEHDIALALYVPDAMLGGCSATSEHPGRRRFSALAGAFLVVLATSWIASRGGHTAATAWLWQVPALLLGLAGCLAITKPERVASLER